MNDWLKKTVVLVLIVAFIAPTAVLLVPQKAEAQSICILDIIGGVIGGIVNRILSVPVADTPTETSTIGTFISDCILKPMLKIAVKELIHNFLTSITSWINSGFDGSGPRFVSDPASFFADIADRAAGQFIDGTDLGYLCSPFALDIRLALGLNYWGGGFRDRITCTLSDIINNTMNAGQRAAYRNSWQSWLDLTTQPQNNPYGAFDLAKKELEIRIANQHWVAGKETDWASGFLTTKRCVQREAIDTGGAFFPTGDEEIDSLTGDVTVCARYETVTPGKLIQEGISSTFQAEINEYVAAEDLDAIFGALINQLMKETLNSVFSATGLFTGGGRNNPNYYRDLFNQRLASGYYNNSTPPSGGMTGVSCDDIQNYILLPNPLPNGTVRHYENNAWTNTNISATDYQKAANYCAARPSRAAAGSAVTDLMDQMGQIGRQNQQSQNFCPTQTRLTSNDILSIDSSPFSFDANPGSVGGQPDYAVDGTTMTYARIEPMGAGAWLEIRFNRPEMLSSIRILSYGGSEEFSYLYRGTKIDLYETDLSATPLQSVSLSAPRTVNFTLNLPTPTRIQKIQIRVPAGGDLFVREINFNRYSEPIVNWSGATRARVGVPFDALDGITATNCGNNSPISNISFSISPAPTTGTPPSYVITGNSITFNAAGTYTITYTASDGTANSNAVRRTITVGSSGSGGSGGSGTNLPPTVNTGADQTITLPNTATLAGVVTDDGLPSPPHQITSTWSRVSGPAVIFRNPNSPNTTAVIITTGLSVLRLTASDGSLSVSDDIQITVNPASTVNTPPVVNAGADQTITLPNTATRAGVVTDDGLPSPPHQITSTWSRVSGPAVIFRNPNSPNTTAVIITTGISVLRLTASDGLLSVSDEITITVNPQN